MALSNKDGNTRSEHRQWHVAADALAKQVSPFDDEAGADTDAALSDLPDSQWTEGGSALAKPAFFRDEAALADQRALGAGNPSMGGTSWLSGSRTVARFGPARIMLAVAVAVAMLEGVYILYSMRLRSTPSVAPTASSSSNGGSPATSGMVADVPAGKLAAVEPGRTDAPRATPVDDAAQRVGRLLVRSEPAGAQVFLDGRALGVTPVTLDKVEPGTRQLLVQHGGAELRQTVRIEPGGTLSVLAPFGAQVTGGGSGYLAIASPIDVDVFEDGTLLGTSRSKRIMLAAGAHKLVFVNESLGFRRTLDVRMDSGRTAQLQIDVPPSTIHINARPWAEVLIDGTPVGETPIGNLPITVGVHEIVFRHPQLGERKMRTTVSAAAPTRVVVDLSQPPPPGR